MPIFPNINIKLVGEDGNAFAILGRCRKAMRENKVPNEEIELFYSQATNGDYNHLLQTVMFWFETDSEENDDYENEYDNEDYDEEDGEDED